MKTKGTVQLIEDDHDLALIYREVFRKHGWKCHWSTNGDQGIVDALKFNPQVIVLDLMLPKRGGMYVLKTLKALPETEKRPSSC